MFKYAQSIFFFASHVNRKCVTNYNLRGTRSSHCGLNGNLAHGKSVNTVRAAIITDLEMCFVWIVINYVTAFFPVANTCALPYYKG